MTSSQLGIYEFGACMKEWAEDRDFSNHQPIGESWGHGVRGNCHRVRKRNQFILKTIT